MSVCLGLVYPVGDVTDEISLYLVKARALYHNSGHLWRRHYVILSVKIGFTTSVRSFALCS